MLFIYKSNQIDILFLKIYQIIQKKPLSYIFEKEIIINDNDILFQYFNIFTANTIGISANFASIKPTSFIWMLFKQVIPNINKNCIFNKSVITWKIMQIIDKNGFLNIIKKFDKKINQFEFSQLITNLLNKYILYRPYWIKKWKKNQKNIQIYDKDEEWQMQLWLKLVNHDLKYNTYNKNFSDYFYQFKSLIKKTKITLPERIFIFTSLSLNPSYMDILNIISAYTDIYLLHVTSFKDVKNIDIKTEENNIKKHASVYSLQNEWVKYDQYHSVNVPKNAKLITKHYYKNNKNNTLLDNIKNDMLYLYCNKNHLTPKSLQKTDNSISINVCYSKQQEIEVLHKTLSKILYNNKEITVSDIVVISFSLEKYITHINNVFQNYQFDKNIPFYIYQKKFTKKYKILSCFEKILNISHTRCNNEEILQLLDIPYFSKHFNISEEEVQVLYHWIQQVKIRWGLNNEKNDFFLKNHQNTWLYGINRLLLNYSINKEQKIWNDILSLFTMNNSRSELIGKLCHLIDILNKWKKKLSKPKKIKFYRLLFTHFINDFLCKNKKITHHLDKINQCWINMINDIESTKYAKNISVRILHKHFLSVVKIYNKKKFRLGVINFCHPSLICYIPFKIKCIIGVDYKSVPQKKYLNNFDLLQKYPLINDKNISDESCYLFVQNVISSQKLFYISYIGYSPKNNEKIYPSILIDQICNYIKCNCYFTKDKIQKIYQNFYTIHKKEHLYTIKNINLQDFNKNNKEIKNNHIKIYQNLFCKHNQNTSLRTIKLKKLISFWKNPIRYFFNKTLCIKFQIKEKNIITEPFSVKSLDVFQINNIILHTIIHHKNIRITLDRIILSGVLPHGFFGSIFLENQIKKMQKITEKVRQYQELYHTKEKFSFQIQQHCIQGSLKNVQKTGLIRWKANKIYYCDQIELWIEHLIYCILGGSGTSRLISYQEILSFDSLPHHVAYNYLANYIQGYIEGIQKPLLLTASGISWLKKIYNKKQNYMYTDAENKKKAYQTLCYTWLGNQYQKGEKENFYIKQITSKLDTKKICKIAKKWFYPILKHKKIQK